jgi:hypothetical protein
VREAPPALNRRRFSRQLRFSTSLEANEGRAGDRLLDALDRDDRDALLDHLVFHRAAVDKDPVQLNHLEIKHAD